MFRYVLKLYVWQIHKYPSIFAQNLRQKLYLCQFTPFSPFPSPMNTPLCKGLTDKDAYIQYTITHVFFMNKNYVASANIVFTPALIFHVKYLCILQVMKLHENDKLCFFCLVCIMQSLYGKSILRLIYLMYYSMSKISRLMSS